MWGRGEEQFIYHGKISKITHLPIILHTIVGGIFRGERNFSLFLSRQLELIQKDKEKFCSARKIQPNGKQL